MPLQTPKRWEQMCVKYTTRYAQMSLRLFPVQFDKWLKAAASRSPQSAEFTTQPQLLISVFDELRSQTHVFYTFFLI